MDDILIPSITTDEGIQNLREILFNKQNPKILLYLQKKSIYL